MAMSPLKRGIYDIGTKKEVFGNALRSHARDDKNIGRVALVPRQIKLEPDMAGRITRKS